MISIFPFSISLNCFLNDAGVEKRSDDKTPMRAVGNSLVTSSANLSIPGPTTDKVLSELHELHLFGIFEVFPH